jgi:hypothetical protein
MLNKWRVKQICKQRDLELWEIKDGPYVIVEVRSHDGFKFRLMETSIYKGIAYESIYKQLSQPIAKSKRII